MNKLHVWELVVGTKEHKQEQTCRMRVPGGWLYQVINWNARGDGMALCFVPAEKEYTNVGPG